MHYDMQYYPQQCLNNFKQNDHIQRTFTPYTPDNPLLTHSVDSDAFFTAIEEALPPVFSRKKAEEILGGLISAKTLSNMDALRTGPPKIHSGSKVGYDRTGFMLWLRGRIKSRR